MKSNKIVYAWTIVCTHCDGMMIGYQEKDGKGEYRVFEDKEQAEQEALGVIDDIGNHPKVVRIIMRPMA